MRCNSAALMAALLLPMAAFSQTLPPGVQKLASVEGITEYALPNGLHVLLFPDPSKPKVTVNMTYLVGSRHEGYGETGMAHLLEHMLFLQDQDPDQHQAGADRPRRRLNGTTSWDRTNYYETVTATDENLRWALELEADRMVNTRMEKPHPRHRNDGGAQRVRDGREQPERIHVPARARSRLPVAQLRPAADRQPLRHRERADRPAGGVLPEVLPARQRRADRRRQVR